MVTVIGSLRYRSEIHGDFACVDMPGLYRPKGARLRRIHRELANPQAQVSSPFFPSFQLPEPFATDRIPLTMHHRALRVRITRIERNIDFLHHRLQLRLRRIMLPRFLAPPLQPSAQDVSPTSDFHFGLLVHPSLAEAAVAPLLFTAIVTVR